MSLLHNIDIYSILVLAILLIPAYLIYAKNKQQSSSLNPQEALKQAGGFIPYIKKLHSEQGAIASYGLPMPNAISCIDTAVMKATLSCGNRPKELFTFLAELLGHDNLQIYEQGRAARFRKSVGAAFGQEVIAAKFATLCNIGIQFINEWKKAVEKNRNGAVIRMQDDCLALSFHISTKTLLSTEVGTDIDLTEFKKAYDLTLGGLFDKQFDLFDERDNQKIQDALKYIQENVKGLIDQRKEEIRRGGKVEKARDLLTIMIEDNDPETGEPFTDDMIYTMMTGFLIASYHTTGIGILWTLFCLAQMPEIQRRLQQEIDTTLHDRLPSLADLANLEFLNSVVKEAFRLHSPSVFAARLLPTDTPSTFTLTNGEELSVEPGTTVLFPIPLVHSSKDYYVDPEKFDPDRWSQQRKDEIKPLTWLPFGYGARMCPAERLAMVEVKLVLLLIMQNFDVELAVPAKKVEEVERFVLMAKDDIPMRLKSRGL